MCDDTCKEVVADPANELLVCTISGRCFDRLLSPSEMDPEVARIVVLLFIYFSMLTIIWPTFLNA